MKLISPLHAQILAILRLQEPARAITIQQSLKASDVSTDLKRGTLYTTLHRLVNDGLIYTQDIDRKRKYQLTDQGHQELEKYDNFCRAWKPLLLSINLDKA